MSAVGSSGPLDASIMLVGEAPGRDEEYSGQPFTGVSGQELTKMLHEAGINRADCRLTNVCQHRPPGNDMGEWISSNKKPPAADWRQILGRWVHPLVFDGIVNLKAEIAVVKPELIVCFGNTSMWALTEKWGITSWRGSQLYLEQTRVLPTYHPAAILRQWSWRHITVHDLRRGKRWLDTDQKVPDWRFIIRPAFSDVRDVLEGLLEVCRKGQLDLAVDIETRDKQTACIGLAWSRLEAICIPLMTFRDGHFDNFWTLDEELWIILKLRELLTHPNCWCCGQNFIYDAQYFAKQFGFVPNLQWDIMSTHHLMMLELPKALPFQASMYCNWYTYWKDEGKLWEPEKMPEEQHWGYNCKDGVYTLEIAQVQRGIC